jgi:hypothetical protein
MLTVTQGFFSVREPSQQEFQHFAQSFELAQTFPAVIALQFIERRASRASGDVSYPITLVAPPTAAPTLLGFDLAALWVWLVNLGLGEGLLGLDFLGEPLLGVHRQTVGELLRALHGRNARQFSLKIDWLRHWRLPQTSPLLSLWLQPSLRD